MLFLADFVYVILVIAVSPIAVYRAIRYGRYRRGWGNRLGKVPLRRDDKKCIWLHAVSVGEINASRTLVGQLQYHFNDYEIVISTTTDTGYDRACRVFGESHRVFFFPLDFSWIMRRAFGRLRPSLCLLMELEVWPNFVKIAQRHNAGVGVVNGRISNRSISRYRLIKPLVKGVFSKLAFVCAQTDEYARRFIELGSRPETTFITGSLKYDTAEITDRPSGADRLARQLDAGKERLWVAGGTGNDEEQILLRVYEQLMKEESYRDVRLVIVPRKPERFEEVYRLIKEAGFSVVRYSRVKEREESVINKKAVILGDTMGDLRKFYSLGYVVFVGRSLVPMGGSDMMESAGLGKCSIFGPYTFNFNQTVDALVNSKGAIQVNNEQELLATMRRCLNEPEWAANTGDNAREVIRKNQGATTRTFEHIRDFFERSS